MLRAVLHGACSCLRLSTLGPLVADLAAVIFLGSDVPPTRLIGLVVGDLDGPAVTVVPRLVLGGARLPPLAVREARLMGLHGGVGGLELPVGHLPPVRCATGGQSDGSGRDQQA